MDEHGQKIQQAAQKRAVQAALQELWDKEDIYSKDFEGLYCVSEEIFYTEKDLVNGKTPLGNEVVLLKEKNYFFKMSKYQQALLDHIQNNKDFCASRCTISAFRARRRASPGAWSRLLTRITFGSMLS